MFKRALSPLLLAATLSPALWSQQAGWSHQGELFLLTTPDGANLAEGKSLSGFPVLVRLDRDWFDFSQAGPKGEDLRFNTADGTPLPCQIEEWDAARGAASIWVRVPRLEGNTVQPLRLRWGNPQARGESDARAVFNGSNGYLSVWHLGASVSDEVGTLVSKDTGTTPVAGVIGQARHFPGGAGIFGGDKITAYPAGGSPHTTSGWFRAEQSNATLLGWGNEGGGRGTKIRMQLRSPAHLHVDSGFSDVKGEGRFPLGEWVHVVHTYGDGPRRIYVNGQVDGEAKTKLDIKTPSRLWLGGWYGNYDFIGDMDEVRVATVYRPEEWVRLEYENQKPLQTLVGPLVRPGSEFSVSPASTSVPEGGSMVFSARIGGARKITWTLVDGGRETVVAVDRFTHTFEAGRVSGDRNLKLVLKAVTAEGVKTREISLAVKEAIPDPDFTLRAPATWDGRTPLELAPVLANQANTKAAGEVKASWKVSGIAVVKQASGGKLLLQRAQNSGRMTVTATLDNGGQPVARTVTIEVTEPLTDPWVERSPEPGEKPVEGQFYARNDSGEGTLHYTGKLDAAAGSVFLTLYADNQPVRTVTAPVGADRTYALRTALKPGLVIYKVEFGTVLGGTKTVLNTVDDLVCGDAFVIEGQSNALATDTPEKSPPETSPWIRSYGRPTASTKDSDNLWCRPVWKAEKGEKAVLGWWGMELAKRLVESQKVPVFIVNGAVGGTRVDQHQRNEANPTDLSTIYGRMLWRVRQARLTHGIRAILWHQGENNQGSASPTGDYDWKSYQDYFVEMSGAWRRDFPNLRHTYVFQIWPNSCAMAGDTGAGDMIREIQRGLPRLHSRMGVMSTLGITPPGGCHYPLAGWSEFARLIQPLIERDLYGKKFAESITPPDLVRASYASPAKDAVILEFDQPVVWSESLAGEFYLDGEKGGVTSGSVQGNVLTLALKQPATAATITYLKESAWSQERLLRGANGIAALTFCAVPLAPR